METNLEKLKTLEAAIAYCIKYLPHQGRLEDFIHHNTLHAFTSHLFDTAVLKAWALYGNEPYPKLKYFHTWFNRGEIEKRDLLKCIEEEVPNLLNRYFQIGAHTLSGMELLDILMLESAPSHFSFFDIHARKFQHAERVFHAWHRSIVRLSRQKKLDLWVPHLRGRTFFAGRSRIFHEALDETFGLVLRCVSSYFDQGVRAAALPKKNESFLGFFFAYFKVAPLFSRHWRRHLSENIQFFSQKQGSDRSQQILLDILISLGIPASEWSHFLFSVGYRFKGWSALILSKTKKEDQHLFYDWMAVLLLCELSKVQELYKTPKKMKEVGQSLPTLRLLPKIYENNLRGIIRHLLKKKISARELLQMDDAALFPIFEVCLTFHNLLKRKLFQKALDQKSKRDFLSAIQGRYQQGEGSSLNTDPKFIALFCIDEREESFRRHLEETEPGCQTEGTVGHFGLNIEFKGYRRSHFRKLCPAPQTPIVRVQEVASHENGRWINGVGRILIFLEHALLHPVRGMLVTLFVSPIFSALFLVRLFFPKTYPFLKKWIVPKIEKTKFILENIEPNGQARLIKAMADTLIASNLKTIQVPYLFIVGHGSISLNNPHEAAYDCGACAGGRGWPNARLFAELANQKEVRDVLQTFGVSIDVNTRFIGAYHNSCSDEVEFMEFPETVPSDLKKYMGAFMHAAKQDAFERNRRFLDDAMPKNMKQAKSNIERRSLALDQVRPEYGHATNAYLVIGSRQLTRGLFMDRRCFLCSYAYGDDPDGTYLRNTLNAVLPVCVGINLEYYFSRVDQERYGCDTKVPHNINGLNGVMNGYMSDLLLGLTLQMTEIHRPVRLQVLIEAPVSAVERALKDLSEIHHELKNEWFYLSVLDPEKNMVFSWENQAFHRAEVLPVRLPEYRHSLDYIRGERDYLGFAIQKGF